MKLLSFHRMLDLNYKLHLYLSGDTDILSKLAICPFK